MRKATQKSSIEQFMARIGQETKGSGSVYFVGGASAVWFGWRASTIDIDIALAPEPAGFFSILEKLKNELNINLELASPDMFVPPLPGWQGRSEFIGRAGLVDFYHYDFYSQALSKLSRGHERDLIDVTAMVKFGKVRPDQLLVLFDQVIDQLPRYPSLDGKALRARLILWAQNQKELGHE